MKNQTFARKLHNVIAGLACAWRDEGNFRIEVSFAAATLVLRTSPRKAQAWHGPRWGNNFWIADA